jgi:anaerobic selenocysteine-containing dehydrogenase
MLAEVEGNNLKVVRGDKENPDSQGFLCIRGRSTSEIFHPDLTQPCDGDAVKFYNERGEFQAKARVTDNVLPGTVWMRDGWVGLNHLTSGDAVLTGDALPLFPFSVGQAHYGARVEVGRC